MEMKHSVVNGYIPILGLIENDTYEEDNKHLAGSTAGIKPDTKIPETAIGFLEEAGSAMKARAQLRDTPEGERTARKIADVFNALTGHNITETDAWTFLLILKLVRSRSGSYHADDYVDLVSYASLLSECEANSARAKSNK